MEFDDRRAELADERRERWERERQAFWDDLVGRNPDDSNATWLRKESSKTAEAVRHQLPKEGNLRRFTLDEVSKEVIDLEEQPDGSYR